MEDPGFFGIMLTERTIYHYMMPPCICQKAKNPAGSSPVSPPLAAGDITIPRNYLNKKFKNIELR
jgi:hypothetical protein